MVPVRREKLCKIQEEEGALSMNLPQQVKACTLVSGLASRRSPLPVSRFLLVWGNADNNERCKCSTPVYGAS